jgi:hypothetical protein
VEHTDEDLRLPISLPVKARFGRTTCNLQTLDISRSGAFIVAPRPPARGQLVHISVILPTASKPLPLQGMVMRSVSGETARDRTVPAGFGIQFYGLGRASEDAWSSFFFKELERTTGRHVAFSDDASLPQPSLDMVRAGETGDDVRDLDEPTAQWTPPDEQALSLTTSELSTPVLYRIAPPDIKGVHAFRTDALESGGVTLLGTSGATPGTPAVVSVVHPVTRVEFHVPGEVQPSTRGLDVIVVRFLGVTDRTKVEFEAFAQAGDIHPAATGNLGPPEVEMVIFESAEESQWDVVVDRRKTVLIDKMLPLQAALDPFARPR